MHGHSAEPFPIVEQQAATHYSAKRVRSCKDGLEHRRQVTRRGIYDLQDFSRRRLALQRLALLGEQPRVFQRDDRLRRKAFNQGDLSFRKRTRLLPVDRDYPEQLVTLEQGNVQQGPNATSVDEFTEGK